MATSKAECEQILNKIAPIGDFTVRPMMGEFLLYFQGKLIGGIYDNRLLLKEVPGVAKYQLEQVVPYASAKRTMFHLADFSDLDSAKLIIMTTYQELQ